MSIVPSLQSLVILLLLVTLGNVSVFQHYFENRFDLLVNEIYLTILLLIDIKAMFRKVNLGKVK